MIDSTVDASRGECPSEAQLVSFASGGTAIGVDLAAHLATCEACTAIVAMARRTAPTSIPPTTPAAMLEPGTMVGRYRIEHRLGAGGMGVVYRATDTELDRAVALKLVRPQSGRLDDLAERLRRESRLQARAAHPAVITVHDIGRDGDQVYVAMELVDGRTLRAWEEARPRGWREIVDVFVQAGAGLAAAHAAGLVHRDFKPDNVLVEERDDRVTRVLVTDFGVARAVAGAEPSSGERPGQEISVDTVDLTVTGSLVGTPAYMAPEQLASGAVDARADVFAFGVALWEALYGERPYVGTTVAALIVAMNAPLSPPARRRVTDRVPRWLQVALRRALATDQASRFRSMGDALAALAWRGRRRRAWLAGGSVGALSTGVVVAGIVVAAGPAPVVSACDRDPGAALRAAAARLRAERIPDTRRDYWLEALDRATTSAIKLRAQTCAASPRPANWADRVRCIDLETGLLVATLDAGVRGDDAYRARLIHFMPPVAPFECASDAAATAAAMFSADATTIAAIVETRDLLATADSSPDPNPLFDRAAELAAHVRSVPLVQAVALARSERRIRTPASLNEIREIGATAERAGYPLTASRALIDLANEILESTEDLERTHDLIALADADLHRAGDPPRLRLRWRVLRADNAAYARDPVATAAEVDAAKDLEDKAGLPFDPVLAADLGGACSMVGLDQRANELLSRANDFVLHTGASSAGETILVRSRYAMHLNAIGKSDEAIAVLRQLVPDDQPVADRAAPEFRVLAYAASLLANTYVDADRSEDAVREVDRWLPAASAALGDRDELLGQLLIARANAELALGRYSEAATSSAEALEIDIDHIGASAYDTADVRIVHAEALLGTDQLDGARRDAEHGLRDLVATAGEADLHAVQAHFTLAAVLIRQGDAAGAIANVEPVIEQYTAAGVDPAILARAQLVLAQGLAAEKLDLPRARALARTALAAWSAQPDDWKKEIGEARALLRHLH